MRHAPPQLDLLTELQQTDSSFPLTGLSSFASLETGNDYGCEETEGACSTSDQVSDIVNEIVIENENRADILIVRKESSSSGGEGGFATTTNSSRNTVLTSTSTIRPAISCTSLASPSNICEVSK